MDTGDIDYLIYVDHPDWTRETGDWRSYISPELRDMWETFLYEQKWAIAQSVAKMVDALSASRAASRPFATTDRGILALCRRRGA